MVDKPNTQNARPRIALCHDWLVARRGGELVLEAIAEAIEPIADLDVLYTMFDSGAYIGTHVDALQRRTSFLNVLPRRLRRWAMPLYPLAVRDVSRKLNARHHQKSYDLVISTHSSAIKAIRTPKGVPHVCYCHAPARYIWNQPGDYAGGLQGLGLSAIRPMYKVWDRKTARRVDLFLANSTHTQTQIRRSYKCASAVCFPPVRTDFFTPSEQSLRRDHWLAVGALVPYKRFDLAIEAANAAEQPLHIIGDGPERARLEKLAGPTISFVQAKTDAQLRQAYRAAKLLIFPQLEDFGIVAIEAQACGTPVVAFSEGGARDTVLDGKTGSLFNEQTVDALRAAIERCPRHAELACRGHAERFGEAVFCDQIQSAIRGFIRRV